MTQTIQSAEILTTIRTFLTRVNRDTEIEPTTPLFGEGMNLDSLETAELSALLEDEHGTDPFSAGGMPQTVGEVLDFYAVAA